MPVRLQHTRPSKQKTEAGGDSRARTPLCARLATRVFLREFAGKKIKQEVDICVEFLKWYNFHPLFGPGFNKRTFSNWSPYNDLINNIQRLCT